MKTTLLFWLCIFFLQNVKAQSYAGFRTNDTTYFTSGAVSPYPDYLRVNWIKDAVASGSDSIFTFYPSVRLFPNSAFCLDTLGMSWSGKTVLRKNNGDEYYYNFLSDSIRIRTQAQLNETWIIATDTNAIEIWGIVYSIDTMSIDGQIDSIKTINLQAYQNALTVAHPHNGKQLIISRNHGFVQVPEWYHFPYTGIYNFWAMYSYDDSFYTRVPRHFTERNISRVLMTKRYQSGNYWQYTDSLYKEFGMKYTHLMINQDSVISSSWLNPSCMAVNYCRKQFRHVYQMVQFPSAQYPQGLYQTIDTFLISYPTDTVCDYTVPNITIRDSIYPETHLNDIQNGSYTMVPSYYFSTLWDTLGLFAHYYSWDDNYGTNPNYNCETKVVSLSGLQKEYYQYLEDFGVFKWDYFSRDGNYVIWEDRHWYITYFNIGNEVFGNHVNIITLPVHETLVSAPFTVFPNPAADGRFYIKGKDDAHWKLFRITGELISNGIGKMIDISSQSAGVYFLEIKEGGRAYTFKLLRNP